jgi:hypothetical protein
MSDDRPHITPDTKVGDILRHYPELEEILISIAPAFSKLRNPVLRRTVAKVTSLRQAARVGGVSVSELVNRLRKEAGQQALETESGETGGATSLSPPDWYNSDAVWRTLDARAMIDSGEQPLGVVMQDLKTLPANSIYELITPFEPAPLIDLAKAQGCQIWCRAELSGIFRTSFRK